MGEGPVRLRKGSVEENEMAVWVTLRRASPTLSRGTAGRHQLHGFTEGRVEGVCSHYNQGIDPVAPKGPW